MKYIKKFEKLKEDINPGDQVVLIIATKYAISLGFKKDNIYTIDYVDNSDDYPYLISINRGIWLPRKYIRLAKQHEIEAIKYNL